MCCLNSTITSTNSKDINIMNSCTRKYLPFIILTQIYIFYFIFENIKIERVNSKFHGLKSEINMTSDLKLTFFSHVIPERGKNNSGLPVRSLLISTKKSKTIYSSSKTIQMNSSNTKNNLQSKYMTKLSFVETNNSSIRITMGPRFQINLKRDPKIRKLKENSTFEDLERLFCPFKSINRSLSKHPCPKDGIVTICRRGRLGNSMWEYSAVLSIAKTVGLKPYISGCMKKELEAIFEPLSIPSLEHILHCPINISNLMRRPEDWVHKYQSIILPLYSQSPGTIIPWMKDIRKEFTFKKDIRIKSQYLIKSAGRLINNSGVYVGVHIRRTDYLEVRKKIYNITEDDTLIRFFYKAMDYFEHKYRNDVVFVVTSDDPDWCLRKFRVKNNIYVSQSYTPAEDLAVLASCNHSIFDFGTFGMWGALLNGGETIFYEKVILSQTFGKFLSNWHSMS